jgi:hypothetical protein
VSEHLSAVAAVHAKHDPPAPPQSMAEWVSHVVPLQQPSGHDVASHTQLPATHRCPSAHCFPVP